MTDICPVGDAEGEEEGFVRLGGLKCKIRFENNGDGMGLWMVWYGMVLCMRLCS